MAQDKSCSKNGDYLSLSLSLLYFKLFSLEFFPFRSFFFDFILLFFYLSTLNDE